MTDYHRAGIEFAHFLLQEARRRHCVEDFNGRDLIIGCHCGLLIAGVTPEDFGIFGKALDEEVARTRIALEEPLERRSKFRVVADRSAKEDGCR